MDFKVIDQIAPELMQKQGDQANSVPIPKFNCSPIQFCNIGPIPWLLHNRGTIHTNQFNCSPKRHHHNTIQSKYNPESPCNPSDNRCTRGPGNRELGRSVGNSNHICLDQHQMQSDSWIPHVVRSMDPSCIKQSMLNPSHQASHIQTNPNAIWNPHAIPSQ